MGYLNGYIRSHLNRDYSQERGVQQYMRWYPHLANPVACVSGADLFVRFATGECLSVEEATGTTEIISPSEIVRRMRRVREKWTDQERVRRIVGESAEHKLRSTSLT